MKDEANFILKMRNLAYVERWASYPVTRRETVAEHSFMVVIIAIVLERTSTQGTTQDVLMKSIMHDAEEAVTGDLLSLVKRFTKDWPTVEERARWEVFHNLTSLQFFAETSKGHPIVKLADTIAALLYATEQVKCGNTYFNDIEAECLYDAEQLALGSSSLCKAAFSLLVELGYEGKKRKSRPVTMTHF